jgi:hypothetical protein
MSAAISTPVASDASSTARMVPTRTSRNTTGPPGASEPRRVARRVTRTDPSEGGSVEGGSRRPSNRSRRAASTGPGRTAMYRGPSRVSRPDTRWRLTSGLTTQNWVPSTARASACLASSASTSTPDMSGVSRTSRTTPTAKPRWTRSEPGSSPPASAKRIVTVVPRARTVWVQSSAATKTSAAAGMSHTVLNRRGRTTAAGMSSWAWGSVMSARPPRWRAGQTRPRPEG